MKEEVWLPVKNFENNYWINSFGEIRSKRHLIKKQAMDRYGYKRTTLCKDGKSYYVLIHRMVAITMIRNYENKCCVNHIDGNKDNNHVSNLEWVTVLENNRHSWRIGNSKTSQKAIDAITKKLSIKIDQFDLSGNFIRSWDSIRIAERNGGYKAGRICKVLKGRAKKHGNSIWKYAI